MYESLINKKRSVILDTDIGPDCDDVGALAILFSYCNQYSVPLLGVCNCTSNIYGSATIDALKNYCNFSDFPIGMYSKPGFYSENTRYNKFIAETYSEKYVQGKLELLPHVSFYRKLLSNAEDDGVILITIGMFNAFADLLKSSPDEISPLSGLELAHKKIHSLVSMAGILPKGREFNIICDHKAAEYCFESFKKPIYLSDFLIGNSIFTGYSPEFLKKQPPNPIFDSYKLYTENFASPGFNKSFDLTAVQFAFEGEGELYSLTDRGRLEFFNEAPDRFNVCDATRFIEDENGNIRFMIKQASDEKIAALLQERMDSFCK